MVGSQCLVTLDRILRGDESRRLQQLQGTFYLPSGLEAVLQSLLYLFDRA